LCRIVGPIVVIGGGSDDLLKIIEIIRQGGARGGAVAIEENGREMRK
jgi:hypothetical protein